MADTTAANGNPNVEALKANAAAAYETVTNGPVAQNVMAQSQKASAELSNLAAARQPPNYSTATGQPLTHYHSFFSELLSWRNPRASAIAYATIVTLIFSVRYLDVLRWMFKLTWMVLGITIAAEVAGKALLNNGFATQLRPRKYYTVPKETLDVMIGDVHELINFFVIESQRVLFAENVYASVAVSGLHNCPTGAPGAMASELSANPHQAALAAFISYYLVKIVPYWGLAVIATTVVFFTPLIYTSNQELIDTQLKHASEVVNAQTSQLRHVAQKHTEQATHLTKQYVGDYTAKAQALLHRQNGQHPKSPVSSPKSPNKSPIKAVAPQDDFKAVDTSALHHHQPETSAAAADEHKPLIIA
ncbi:hypothetical protein N0V88_005098 [Collariella sp. IMI 366227]|nr:hypothetical protein N0V88_005098 [Collariella sp. IMI 366227]